MANALGIVIALACLVTLVIAEEGVEEEVAVEIEESLVNIYSNSDSYCLDGPDRHLKQCDHGSICAWNKCKCPGRKGCRLVCTKNRSQWCNGLSEGENCIGSFPQYECTKSGKKLACTRNPIGPVCSRDGNRYYAYERFETECEECFCFQLPRPFVGVGLLKCKPRKKSCPK